MRIEKQIGDNIWATRQKQKENKSRILLKRKEEKLNKFGYKVEKDSRGNQKLLSRVLKKQ